MFRGSRSRGREAQTGSAAGSTSDPLALPREVGGSAAGYASDPLALPRELPRVRLLEAAGEVFGERGFNDATVREICRRAGANVAAVNYHFGDKAGLYRATLLHAHQACRIPPDGGIPAGAPPETRLRGFIDAFMARLLATDRPAWHARLMGREMVEPTGLIDELVREGIRPHYLTLGAIVRELLPPGASPEEVHLAALSVIGQCVFYRHCAPVIAIMEKQGAHRVPLERLQEHVYKFTSLALAGWRARSCTGQQ